MEKKSLVSLEEKKSAVESSLYELSRFEPFYAGLIQELNIKFDPRIPTAGLVYNDKTLDFEIWFNTEFFMGLAAQERAAVLLHECLHFSHKHFLRTDLEEFKKDAMMYNIAMDMSINQYIRNLPGNCVDVKKFKYDDGTPFPLLRPFEEYYELLKKNQKHNFTKGKGKGKGEGDNPQPGDSLHGQPLDEHNWNDLTEEQKRKMLEEAKRICERAIEKINYGFDQVPDSIKDLIKEIEQKLKEIDYKAILRNCIKKSLSIADRESTWNRPNKRYGVFSPGSRMAKIPFLNIYVDTSGSISYNELSEFIKVIEGFLRAGSKRCNLGLWHTALYYMKPFKLAENLKEKEIEQGGTDVSPVMAHIKKNKPNLSIILTDGYYGNINELPKDQILWIITKEGCFDHPLKSIGKTIKLEGIVS